MKTFDIYVSDLKPEVAEKFLEFHHLKTAEDGNFDVTPIAVFEEEAIEVSEQY